MKKRSFLIFIIIIACNTAAENKKEIPPPYVGTGKLIPINFSDSNYADVIHYAADTITPSGWQIKYLVKDDSTRYSDIYIQWSKEKIMGIYKAEDALDMKRYFIPKYAGEVDRVLFFTHGCATDCGAILTLSKGPKVTAVDNNHIVDYDLSLGQFLFVAEESYNKEDSLELVLIDMVRPQEDRFKFKAENYLHKESAVQKVKFSKDELIITIAIQESPEDTFYTVRTIPISLNHKK